MVKQSYTYEMWPCKPCLIRLILSLGKVTYIRYDSVCYPWQKKTQINIKNFKFSLINFCMFDLLVFQLPDGLWTNQKIHFEHPHSNLLRSYHYCMSGGRGKLRIRLVQKIGLLSLCFPWFLLCCRAEILPDTLLLLPPFQTEFQVKLVSEPSWRNN